MRGMRPSRSGRSKNLGTNSAREVTHPALTDQGGAVTQHFARLRRAQSSLPMFNKRTVFIVGAGASAECGLPSGATLKEKIAEGFNFYFEAGHLRSGDGAILEHLRRRFSDVNLYVKAGRELSATIATFPSIDEALHWWRARDDIVELGKLATAHYVLDAEHRSLLARKHGTVDPQTARDTWLAAFMSIALSAFERDEANKAFENITIINFNYDRTIEHYLYWAMQQQAGVSSDTAAQCVARLNMIRPYGSIGKLEWQEESGIPFGGNNNQLDANTAAANIRTFTEQIDDTTVDNPIEEALDSAHLVIFLGFGFHQQNMDLLRVRVARTNAKRPMVTAVLATTLGVDRRNDPAIEARLGVLGLPKPMLVSCKAADLYYW
jgi:hypothetical protein